MIFTQEFIFECIDYCTQKNLETYMNWFIKLLALHLCPPVGLYLIFFHKCSN